MKKNSTEYLQLIATDPQTKDMDKAGKLVGKAGLIGLSALAAIEIILTVSGDPERSHFLIPFVIIAPAVLCIARAANRFKKSENIIDAKIADEENRNIRNS